MKIANRIFDKDINFELSSFLGLFGAIDNKYMWACDGNVGQHPWQDNELSIHCKSCKILIIDYL